MALTIGSAPFTHPPGGTYNFDLERVAPEHILYLEKVLKRIRGVLDGETIVDTRHGSMLHETGEFIQWYLPVEDVRPGVLERSDRQAGDPYKGEATYYHVRVGDHVESDSHGVTRDHRRVRRRSVISSRSTSIDSTHGLKKTNKVSVTRAIPIIGSIVAARLSTSKSGSAARRLPRHGARSNSSRRASSHVITFRWKTSGPTR